MRRRGSGDDHRGDFGNVFPLSRAFRLSTHFGRQSASRSAQRRAHAVNRSRPRRSSRASPPVAVVRVGKALFLFVHRFTVASRSISRRPFPFQRYTHTVIPSSLVRAHDRYARVYTDPLICYNIFFAAHARTPRRRLSPDCPIVSRRRVSDDGRYVAFARANAVPSRRPGGGRVETRTGYVLLSDVRGTREKNSSTHDARTATARLYCVRAPEERVYNKYV